MKNIKSVLILFIFLFGLTPEYSQDSGNKFHFPEIKSAEAQSPVTLSQVDFSNVKNIPSKVKNRVRKIILNYYFDSGFDSLETNIKINEVYFNTLMVSNGSYSFFFVILKAPAHLLTSKMFAYDNTLDSAMETEIDYNINAMYDIADNMLKDSNLKKEFKINLPDIELIEPDSNGTYKLMLRRLSHNGTENAKETSIYKIEGKRIIRTYFNMEKFSEYK